MTYPSQKAIRAGFFKEIDGVMHKRCAGTSHEEPVYLPATEKYFFVHKANDRKKGQFLSRCRLCTAWDAGVKTKGSYHGLVDATDIRHLYIEAANRVGVFELSRRTGIYWESIIHVITGKTKSVRKANLRKVMLELVSMRRKNEHSISAGSIRWVIRRGSPYASGYCAQCGSPFERPLDTCNQCKGRAAHKAAHDASVNGRPASVPKGHCIGCGNHKDDPSNDCKVCIDRERRRNKRRELARA